VRKRAARAKSRVLIVLAAWALLAAAFVSAELWARRRWAPQEDPVSASPEFDFFHLQIHDDFFTLDRRFGVIPFRWKTQRERAPLQFFSLWKPKGTLRVFVVGGSVAMGFDSSSECRLAEYLRKALPGRNFEVVGTGMGGYDSYRESLVEKEVLRHDPDLIVLLSGNNEYGPRLHVNATLFRLNRWLRKSRLYARFQDAYRGDWKEPRWPLDERLQNFSDNLRLMISRAGRRNVPMILCTLPVNIRDIPPTFSPPPVDDAGYFKARAALDRGRLGEASQAFAAYVAARPREPFGYYWLGKARDRLGDAVGAREAYMKAVDWDDPGSRCSLRRNAIIRGLAGENRVAVADVEAAFSRAVPDGLTDSRLFKDDVHWYDEYYPLVSLTIIRAVADYDRSHDVPMLAPPAEWNRWWETEPGAEASLAHPAMSPERRLRYAEEVFISGVSKVFQLYGFVECSVSYMMMAERLDPGIMKRSLTSRDWLQARSDQSPWLEHVRYRLKDEWFRVLLHAGEASRRLGLTAQASGYFDEALRLSPDDPYAHLWRGVLESSAGKRREAGADLRRAAGSGQPGMAAWAAAVGS
jgi:tetratricopeptide (TPR) repeat protein